jgi:ribosomal-protein-alanine N-acetyltransferase
VYAAQFDDSSLAAMAAERMMFLTVCMIVLETERLRLRWLTRDDAPFIIELLNDPSFIRFIGDKGVRTKEDAEKYLVNGPLASYEQFGYGLYATELKDSSVPIGICGLLKRETLPHPDIGFAFLPAYWSQGYAFEASNAVMRHARAAFNLSTILAITTPENEASGKLLAKIGMAFDRLIKLTPESDEVKLFSTTTNGNAD